LLHFWAIWGEKIAKDGYTSEEGAREAMTDWHGWYYLMTGEANKPELKSMMRRDVGGPSVNVNEEEAQKAELKEVSIEELKRHASRDDCWVAVDGLVLDVSTWLQRHPGGGKILLGVAGTDATAKFHALRHSATALNAAKGMSVGKLGPLSEQHVGAPQ
jgi:cytochrome b involved in lipid metabolism